MASNKGGVTFALIIVLLVSVAFGYILTSPTGGGLQPSKNPTKYTQYVNLGADAAGWEYNYNTSLRNPVLNVVSGTKVVFNITEMDGAPHNLYIAYDGKYTSSLFQQLVVDQKSSPKKIEGSTNYQILSTAQITQTIGHKTQGNYPFFKDGIYTYWCSIHYATMVGLLIVNSTSSTSTSFVALHAYHGEGPSHVYNQSTYSTHISNVLVTLERAIKTVE
jgi:plastocyanin